VAALTAAIPPLALAEAWLAHQNGPSSQATALQWLQGHGSQQQIQAALAAVLANLWAQAFNIGVQAALALVKVAIALQLVRDALKQLEYEWLDDITATRMERLAAVLAKGGTPAELAKAIAAVLGDKDAAHLIAITESNRAMNAGRFQVYRAAQVPKVRWITTSKDPCHICLENEAAEPRYLGVPFPSGAIMPPEHPQCQCELIPAE
jgi:hypothetical protein